MKLEKVFYTILLLGVLSVSFSGCGDDSDDVTEADSTTEKSYKNITLNFDAVVNGDELLCSEDGEPKRYSGVGLNEDNITIKDFRFFVSEVEFIKDDGSFEKVIFENNGYQYEENGIGTALLDFEDNTGNCINSGNGPTTNRVVLGKVADGNYTGLRFTLGVPIEINHVEYPEVEALTHTKMSWNWAAGRKFTKLEAIPDSNTTMTWYFHLGSTGCEDTNSDGISDVCAQPNRVTVKFNSFDLDNDTITIDYAKLLENSEMYRDLGGAKGCMSALTDPECREMLSQLGIDVDTANGLSIDQSIFYLK